MEKALVYLDIWTRQFGSSSFDRLVVSKTKKPTHDIAKLIRKFPRIVAHIVRPIAFGHAAHAHFLLRPQLSEEWVVWEEWHEELLNDVIQFSNKVWVDGDEFQRVIDVLRGRVLFQLRKEISGRFDWENCVIPLGDCTTSSLYWNL